MKLGLVNDIEGPLGMLPLLGTTPGMTGFAVLGLQVEMGLTRPLLLMGFLGLNCSAAHSSV